MPLPPPPPLPPRPSMPGPLDLHWLRIALLADPAAPRKPASPLIVGKHRPAYQRHRRSRRPLLRRRRQPRPRSLRGAAASSGVGHPGRDRGRRAPVPEQRHRRRMRRATAGQGDAAQTAHPRGGHVAPCVASLRGRGLASPEVARRATLRCRRRAGRPPRHRLFPYADTAVESGCGLHQTLGRP